MAVMQVGLVRVLVHQRLVTVRMGMRLGHGCIVSVLVVLVVNMKVLVLDRPVLVHMGMFFRCE